MPPRSQAPGARAGGKAGRIVLVRHASIPPTRRNAVAATLAEAGWDVVERADGAVEPEDRLVLVYGNARWFPEVFRSLARLPAGERPFSILWQLEPLPLPRGSGFPRRPPSRRELAKILLRDPRITDPGSNLRRLRSLAAQGLPDLLLASTASGAETLRAHGVRAETLLLGYHPLHGRPLGLERDIDVLFLGALEVPRRRRLLRGLRRAGVEVQAMGSWSDPRFWGAERERLVNRARIFLNLSRFPGQFSGPRLVLGMANGALVVSEPMHRPEPFVAGEHFVSGAIEELPALIGRYLEDEQARLRIAQRGHELVTRELTMARSLERMLALARGRGGRKPRAPA